MHDKQRRFYGFSQRFGPIYSNRRMQRNSVAKYLQLLRRKKSVRNVTSIPLGKPLGDSEPKSDPTKIDKRYPFRRRRKPRQHLYTTMTQFQQKEEDSRRKRKMKKKICQAD